MPGFKCCVPKCMKTNTDSKMHVISSLLYEEWLRAIDRVDLLSQDRKKVRANYRVCDNHFREEEKVPGTRLKSNLKKDAIPSLGLKCSDVTPVSIPAGTEIQRSPRFKHCLPSFECTSMEIEKRDEVSMSPQGNIGTPRQIRTLGHEISIPKCMEELERNSGNSATSPYTLNSNVAVKPLVTWETPKKPADFRKKLKFLSAVNVTRAKQLTPKALKFYRVAKRLKMIGCKAVNTNVGLRERLEAAEKWNIDTFLDNAVNKVTKQFILLQLRTQKKKCRGRRYTIDDKIFCLALYKRGPKSYRYLQKTFALPSKKCVMSLLYKIPFDVGLNENVMKTLKEDVAKMKPEDRYCCLLFDEMSLESALDYNEKRDAIDGWQDFGDRKTLSFADHATLFVLRGIRRKWKQPIGFFFVTSGMKSPELAKNIKAAIRIAASVQLTVVATVCDQYSTNCAALSLLMKESRAESLRNGTEYRNSSCSFMVDGTVIFILYDVPHLLKGLRNNFLDGTVTFTWNNVSYTGKWSDIILLYESDNENADFKMLNKLTDEHIYASKMRKMKVSVAAQVLSQRVAATLKYLAHCGNCLSSTAEGTANFCLFSDKVFDSFNGNTINPSNGKLLRCAVKSKSPHHEFWNDALNVFRSMTFEKSGKEFVPPTVRNWMRTIRATQCLWTMLEKKGFKFLHLRNLNQDPIEHTFGDIRQQSGRDINPTCSHFRAALKTILVNNFVSSHSASRNCEEDETEALSTLRTFLSHNHAHEDTSYVDNLTFEIQTKEFVFTSFSKRAIHLHAFLAGFVAKKMFKKIRVCKNCRRDLISSSTNVHDLIEARAYNHKALLRPDTWFVILFGKVCDIVRHYLPILAIESNIKTKLVFLIRKFINPTNFTCNTHNTFDIFIDYLTKFYIHTWVKNVNNILKGKDSRLLNENDPVKKLAIEKFTKSHGKKEAIRRSKKVRN